MNEQQRDIQVPFLTRNAPVSAVEGKIKTYRCMFSGGAQVRRYDWWNDEIWVEELEISRGALDLARLNSGAPLLNAHQRYDVSNVFGVIERAWLDGGEAMAEWRFSERADVQPYAKDVEDKVLRNVSAGYDVYEFKEVGRQEKTGYRIMRATNWAPFEISLVPVGADAGAQTRSRDSERLTRCKVFLLSNEAVRTTPVVNQPTAPAVTPEKGNTMDPKDAPAAGPTGEEAERARTKGLCDLGDQYGKWVTQRDVGDAIRNGRSVEAFKDQILERMQSKHTDTSALHIGLTRSDVQRYSLGRAIVASLTGDWSKAGFERECSRAVEKLMGATPEGFFVPFEAWQRDFNVGTGTEAGNLVANELRTDLYVDAYRNAMVLARMGVRILAGVSGNLDIPRKSSAGTIGMVTEIGSASETNPLTALLSLTPKRMSAYTEYSKQALIQSAMALEPMLRDDLLVGAAVKMEQQAFNGVGSSGEFTGLRITSGIGTSTAGSNGAALAWDHLVDLESQCANNNAEPDRLAGYVTNTRVRGKAKRVQKGTNLPFIWTDGDTPLNGYRAGITNNIPNNLTKGTSTTICSAALFASDWSMYVLALFGAPDITVDPYTKADTGQVRITLNQFADGGARQPAAFSRIEDLLTT